VVARSTLACPELRRAIREPISRLLIVGAGGLAVAATAAAVSEAGEIPLLSPGRPAHVSGTQISCTATTTSVSCEKAGGLTATMVRSGAVNVSRGPATPPSTLKPMQLHVNGGFANVGADNSNVYCHVYVAGTATLDCSLTGAASGHLPNSHGFDISNRSVVVFVFDKAGNRRDVKTVQQP
jgi:hypothetical protein